MSRSRRRRSSSWASTSRSRETPQLVGPDGQLGGTQLELGAQPRSAQHQPGLGGQPGEQALLDHGQGHVLPLLDDEDAEQLAAVVHRTGPAGRVAGVERVGPLAECRVDRARRPGRGERRPVVHDQPHLRPLRAGALGQHPRHPGRQLLRREAARRGPGEPPQHVVRRGVTALDGAGGEALEPGLDGVEGQGHHGGGEHGERQVGGVGAADEQAAAEHDHDVGHHHEGGQAAEHDRAPQELVTGPSAHACRPAHSCSVLAPAPAGEGAARTPVVGLAARPAPPHRADRAGRRAPSPMGARREIESSGSHAAPPGSRHHQEIR